MPKIIDNVTRIKHAFASLPLFAPTRSRNCVLHLNAIKIKRKPPENSSSHRNTNEVWKVRRIVEYVQYIASCAQSREGIIEASNAINASIANNVHHQSRRRGAGDAFHCRINATTIRNLLRH